MPHNLYLHSSIVQTRKFGDSNEAKKEGIQLNMIDTVASLLFAFFINSAILVLAAAAFHGKVDASEAVSLQNAYTMLSPALGTVLAMYAFAIALLASGQSSTFTGTIAGQVILEGYMNLKIPCWQRRIITRSLALIPAIIGIQILGDNGLDALLVLSQVILGLQLPFVIYPLLKFSSDKKLMGIFSMGIFSKIFAWFLFFVIGGCNFWLVYLLTK
jgi:manganese transport protein